MSMGITGSELIKSQLPVSNYLYQEAATIMAGEKKKNRAISGAWMHGELQRWQREHGITRDQIMSSRQ